MVVQMFTLHFLILMNSNRAPIEHHHSILSDQNMMEFTSPEDLTNNLPITMADVGKAMGGGGFPTDSPLYTR